MLYLVVAGMDKYQTITSFFTNDWEAKGLLALGLTLLSIITNAQLDRESKASLVFWRRKNPQPASRAFSLYVHNDVRVDTSVISHNYGQIPTNEDEQNKYWYKIYKKFDDKPSVILAHRHWLLTRDFASIAVTFIVVSIPVHLIMSSVFNVVIVHWSICIAIYLLCMGAARTNGVSFVNNVLAEASAR